MTHDDARPLIPAYALDALAPDEARAAEAHLATCEECRRELGALREAAAALASGFPTVAPPPALRDQILAAARRSRRTGLRRRSWGPALAAAAVLVLLLGGLSLFLAWRLRGLDQQVAAQAQVLTLLADPAAKDVALSGSTAGRARLVFDPARRQGALVASGLLNPGRQSVYQVWLIAGQKPESAAVFRPAQAQATVVPVQGDFSRYQTVAISIEPAPSGSPQPTTAPILVGALSGAR